MNRCENCGALISDSDNLCDTCEFGGGFCDNYGNSSYEDTLN